MMNASFRRLIITGLIAVLVMALALPAYAQDDEIPMEPFNNANFGISGVKPADWIEAGPGIYARNAAAQDVAMLMQQSLPGGSVGTIQANLMPGLLLETWPEPNSTLETEDFAWDLYVIPVEVSGMTIIVEAALAQTEDGAYLVLLQAQEEDFEALREAAFMPAVEALTLLSEDFVAEPAVDLDEGLPYVVEYVTFESMDADGEAFSLAGTLTMPPTDGPHPAVILISGSGPSDRDESLEPMVSIRPFRLISDYLTQAGIAVLRYDDRGVGESGGVHDGATSADFAVDTEAAITYLLARDDINAEQIGLLGHSEGGLIASIVTARNEDVAFMISMAGSSVQGVDILVKQNERIMQAAGMSDAEVETMMEIVNEIFDLALAEDWEGLEEALALVNGQDQFAIYQDPWYNYFINYDPTDDLLQITIPVLALFGELDVQVDADQNASALEAALEAAENEDFTIVILPDANHLFQSAVTGGVNEYSQLEPEFTPDFLPTIVEWLLERVDVQHG